jgi:hypothetical protein
MARHIYGDSNIMKYLPLLKEKKSDPMIQAVTASKATNLVLLRDLNLSPKAAHAVLIISALTNIITAKYFDDFNAMTEHCQTTFNDLLLWLQEGRDHLEGFAEQVRFQPPYLYLRLAGAFGIFSIACVVFAIMCNYSLRVQLRGLGYEHKLMLGYIFRYY